MRGRRSKKECCISTPDLVRRLTPQIVADGVDLCRRFRPDVFGIEANQFQELLGGEFAAELARQKLIGIVPWAIENRVNKQTRIRRLGPYLSNRRIKFKSGSPGTRLLVEQMKEFPLADHDDGPDAAEMWQSAWPPSGSDRRGRGDGLGDRLAVECLGKQCLSRRETRRRREEETNEGERQWIRTVRRAARR